MPESHEEHLATTDALEVEAKRLRSELGLDSVQIVATLTDASGITTRLAAGAGNWHARMHSIREILTLDDQRTRNFADKPEGDTI